MKIYIAHPFDTRHDIEIWQHRTEIEGIEFLNPFYDIERKDMEDVDQNNITRHDISTGKYLVDPEKIVSQDLNALTNCDAIMAYISGHTTIGTHMEMAYAHMYGIPVHTIALQHKYHPWIQYHSTTIFDSLCEYEDYLKVNSEKV